jgi:plasmid stabilization system protein ParE
MTPRLFVRDDAAADIAEAAAWYEARRDGLGSEFTRAVRAALAGVERQPLRFPLARGEVRRARVRRFPYIVIFIPESAQTVVIAVLHGRRDPQVWQTRRK